MIKGLAFLLFLWGEMADLNGIVMSAKHYISVHEYYLILSAL